MYAKAPKTILKTSSYEFMGFESISVQKSMLDLYGEFDLVMADRTTESEGLPINLGEDARLYHHSHLIETGYIDMLGHSFGSDGTKLELYGKSRSCDVEDSSIELKSNEFKGEQNLDSIAGKLLKGFDSKLIIDRSLGALKLKNWKIDPGEKIGYNLLRAARKLEIMIYCLPDGNLYATKASRSIRECPVIEQGKNLIDAQKYIDYSGLYTKYMVRAIEEKNGELKPSLGIEIFPHPRKSRVSIINYDGSANNEECKTLAKWERITNQANSYGHTIRVAGWLNSIGRPWELNTQVFLNCPKIRTQKHLLVTEINFEYSKKDGHTSTLELKHPDAFKALPFIASKEKDDDYQKRAKELGY